MYFTIFPMLKEFSELIYLFIWKNKITITSIFIPIYKTNSSSTDEDQYNCERNTFKHFSHFMHICHIRRGGNFDSSRAGINRRGHSFVVSDRNTFNGRVRWVRRRELEEGKAIRHLCEKENRVNCKGLLVGHAFIVTNIFSFSLCCPVLSVYNVWVEKIAERNTFKDIFLILLHICHIRLNGNHSSKPSVSSSCPHDDASVHPKARPRLTPCEVRLWVGSGRLPRRLRAGRFNLHVSFQVEQGYRSRALYSQLDSQAVEALDLPTPTCFRSRSHSYLRAIQAGCSQDDDTGSVDSDETPPITSSISSYNSATGE